MFGSNSILLSRYLKGDRFGRYNYTGQWKNGNIAGGGIIHWNNGARLEITIQIETT